MNEIPFGFCHCGCGLPAPLASKTMASRGWIKGEPIRYIHGHATGKHETDPNIQAAKDLKCRQTYKAKRKEQGRIFVFEYLKTHPCIDCGESDPVVLDFDHIDPNTKKASISQLIAHNNASVETLQTEIAKCKVRCANCHRRKTFKERGLTRNFS